MTSNCLTCGEEFTWNRPSRPQECCSISCAVRKPGRAKSGPKPKPRVIADCEWCGKPVKWASRPSQQGKFCSRVCSGRARTKGGVFFRDGRWQVRLRDGGYQIFSRCLMEGHLGRHLASDEHVHHINEDKADDRIENFAVVTPAEHLELHRAGITAARRASGKLSRAEVAYIKDSLEPTSVLARRFNVTDGAITYHRGAILKSLGRA